MVRRSERQRAQQERIQEREDKGGRGERDAQRGDDGQREQRGAAERPETKRKGGHLGEGESDSESGITLRIFRCLGALTA